MAEARESADFTWSLRVYYEDTDTGGVVYYANYLKFFERARTEWLRSLGVEQEKLAHTDQVMFVVRRTTVDYLKPAKLDDELFITVTVQKLGRASVHFVQEAWRVKGQEREELANGSIYVACVDKLSVTPRAIPKHVMQSLLNNAHTLA